ncbi:hypothetical protein EVAR_27501_1 [Eumeta japonica]|uniref:Uncharacterized protein n=1 Tax=Eumeta variegata TaxID=151549 RepID=A0A4C1XGP1_EUMVA|nr:hypothetical protein EVAR_27501_1 [Eumeta japonica]
MSALFEDVQSSCQNLTVNSADERPLLQEDLLSGFSPTPLAHGHTLLDKIVPSYFHLRIIIPRLGPYGFPTNAERAPRRRPLLSRAIVFVQKRHAIC